MVTFTCKNPSCKQLIISTAGTSTSLVDLLGSTGYDRLTCSNCGSKYYMGRGICGKLLTEAEFRELTAKPPEVEAELALLREAIAGKDIKLYEYGIDPLPWGKLSKKLDIDYPHVVVMGENDVRLFGWKNGQKVMTLLSVARAVPSD